jgi:hypothetical protein
VADDEKLAEFACDASMSSFLTLNNTMWIGILRSTGAGNPAMLGCG